MRDIRNEVLEGEPVFICNNKELEEKVRESCFQHIIGFTNLKILGDLRLYVQGDSALRRLNPTLPTQEEVDLFLGGCPIGENHLHLLAGFFNIGVPCRGKGGEKH